MSDPRGGKTTPAQRSYNRSVFARVLTTFYQACDQPDAEVARALLRVLETMISPEGSGKEAGRTCAERSLVAAHERLRKVEDRRRDRPHSGPLF
jgi:hypothetical protein